MNHPRYEFRTDPKTGLLELESQGFWDMDVARAFLIDLQRETALARQKFGRLRFLIDATRTEIQSAEVIGSMEGIEAVLYILPADRSGILAESTLARMQHKRRITSPQGRAFLTRDEAIAWLVEA